MTSALSPPRVIETPRLRLRSPVDTDIDAVFEYASDPLVTRYMDWARLSVPKEVEQFFVRTTERWESGTEFTWVLTPSDSDAVIGAISLRPRIADADFGYVLNRHHWSKGFASEAGAAVTSWALQVRRIPRLWATCDVENARSARV